MTTDINQRLAEIKERAERASPGDWLPKPRQYDDWGWVRSADGHLVARVFAGRYVDEDEKQQHRSENTDPYQDNMDFIANARSDVPFLLAEIERLTAERDAAWEAGRDAAVKIVSIFEQGILSRQDGKNHAVDTVIRTMAVKLPDIEAAIRALTSNKSATIQRCGRLSCGLREMKTEPPLSPPLMVCDQADCDRAIRALATSKPE